MDLSNGSCLMMVEQHDQLSIQRSAIRRSSKTVFSHGSQKYLHFSSFPLVCIRPLLEAVVLPLVLDPSTRERAPFILTLESKREVSMCASTLERLLC